MASEEAEIVAILSDRVLIRSSMLWKSDFIYKENTRVRAIAWAINAVLLLLYVAILTFLMVSEAVMNLAWFSYTRCCMSLSNCLTSGRRSQRHKWAKRHR